MFEDIIYEKLLKRMLERVPNNLDTREGSIIFNAIAPAAVELQNIYIELDYILKESFADTASREHLIKRAEERGIAPNAATKAILKGAFNTDVPIGSRFSLDKLNYIVVKKISLGVFQLECEIAGMIGNRYLGELIPIEYIDGLKTAALTEVLIPGEDEESTDSLYQRYLNSFDTQIFGGNIKDYKVKVNALDGIGGVKVYPVWNGGGTVKLVVITSDYKKPTDILVSDVQTAIDPIQNSGKGLGIAPIGHRVTVFGVDETLINISTNITYQDDTWNWERVKNSVETAIDNYFLELSTKWESEDSLIVRISQIEMRILALDGIKDIADTSLNGLMQNLTLSADNIPERGMVNG